MHTVPLTPPYTYSVSVPIKDIPASTGAIDAMLVDHIARPLSLRLIDAGYEVDDLNLILEGSLITVDTQSEPERATFLVVFPHPPGDRPHEIHPLRGIVAELVGGERDGHRPPVKPEHHEQIRYTAPGAKPGEYVATYQRSGYNLADGSWSYMLVKQPVRQKPDTDKAGA